MEADLRNSVSVVNAQMEEVVVGRVGCGGISCNFLGAGENTIQPVPVALHLVQNIPNYVLSGYINWNTEFLKFSNVRRVFH